VWKNSNTYRLSLLNNKFICISIAKSKRPFHSQWRRSFLKQNIVHQGIVTIVQQTILACVCLFVCLCVWGCVCVCVGVCGCVCGCVFFWCFTSNKMFKISQGEIWKCIEVIIFILFSTLYLIFWIQIILKRNNCLKV
jgi:hypothetical protein